MTRLVIYKERARGEDEWRGSQQFVTRRHEGKRAKAVVTDLDGLEVVDIESVAELVDTGGTVDREGGGRASVSARGGRRRHDGGPSVARSHLVKGDEFPSAICKRERRVS